MKKRAANNYDYSGYSWKRRPSEIRGYQRALYLTADNNDYLRVDYNLREKIVRLYIEIAEEGGNAYYAVIKEGRVTVEKSLVSGRTFGFAERFRERAEIFSSIPNRDVIKLINKNYNIDFPQNKEKAAVERKKKLEETRKRYFVTEDQKKDTTNEQIGLSFSEIKAIDFIDFFVGSVLSGTVFFLLQYDFVALGIVSAFYGIGIGLVDMIFRERPPIFIKMILFISAGVTAYVYGYFFP